jgi:putative hydrolase of the HAD superfamily
MQRYKAVEGTIDWYCVDYWTQSLQLDIAFLKEEVAHLIAVHPYVTDFLESLSIAGKRPVLVTNAHHKSIALKMRHTLLGRHFDQVVCAHDFGIPKEDGRFWDHLRRSVQFDPQSTLLIDDNEKVLLSACNYGIRHLLAVSKPDTQQAGKNYMNRVGNYSPHRLNLFLQYFNNSS